MRFGNHQFVHTFNDRTGRYEIWHRDWADTEWADWKYKHAPWRHYARWQLAGGERVFELDVLTLMGKSFVSDFIREMELCDSTSA